MTHNNTVKFEGRVPGRFDKFSEGWWLNGSQLSGLSKVDLEFFVREEGSGLGIFFFKVVFVFLEGFDFFCIVGIEHIID